MAARWRQILNFSCEQKIVKLKGVLELHEYFMEVL